MNIVFADPRLDKKEDEMTVEQLKDRYDHMTRHASEKMMQAIRSSGPLCSDPFIRTRQVLYRKIFETEHGVIFSGSPDGIMHIPF